MTTTDRVAPAREKQVPMSAEDWEVNKVCALKKRDHKWYWKYDSATNAPSAMIAVCAHCGEETVLTRKDGGHDA